jgi:DNA relaxase NicK
VAAQQELSTTVLESQVDYLTVAAHSSKLADRWHMHCLHLQQLEAHQGAKLGPFRSNQYVGQICGRVAIGLTDDACLVQLSGEAATDQFEYFWPDHDSVTRLDVAVTIRTSQYDEHLGERRYYDALRYREDHPHAAMPSLIINGDGGATFYIGSRKSARFFRFYNKQAECLARHDLAGAERYDCAWRLEMELHDVDAQAVGMMLAEPGVAGSKIRYYIGRYLIQHGIECPYDMSQRETLPRGFRRRSDRDTRLDWLGKTVKPTIDWLRTSCTAEELRDILGLGGSQELENDYGRVSLRD